MRMARASKEDLDDASFDEDEPVACARVLAHLRTLLGRTSLSRVVHGMQLLLDPANRVVDPDLPHLELHPRFRGGAVDVANERAKQREKWGDSHDDEHSDGMIAAVAAELALAHTPAAGCHSGDPWGLLAKHPATRDRLVIAGALIAAEIDRLDRAAANGGGDATQAR